MLLDQKVCYKCFENLDLQKFIKNNSASNGCDFCRSKSKSHELSEILDFIIQCIHAEYTDPVHEMGWNGREGGYIGAETLDSYELLERVGLDTNNEELFDVILSNLPSEIWCENEPYQLREHEELNYTWKNFSNTVKYKCRYTFLQNETTQNDRTLQYDLVSNILNKLSDFFKNNDLIINLKKGTKIFRVRKFDNNDPFELTLSEICTPPENKTISSRMSPAGIPMFYGAKDLDTAIKEVGVESGKEIVYAQFKLTKDCNIIDLTKLPEVPSFFSGSDSYTRSVLKFLHDFLTDFTKPIAKDGIEHIEYVPTQILTEFCKYYFQSTNTPIDGFAYPSSVKELGISYCIFADREQCGIHTSNYIKKKQILEIVSNSIKKETVT